MGFDSESALAVIANKSVATNTVNDYTLIAIATVAVVVWTGALLYKQLKDGWQNARINRELKKLHENDTASTGLHEASDRAIMTFDGVHAGAMTYTTYAFMYPLIALLAPQAWWRFMAILALLLFGGAMCKSTYDYRHIRKQFAGRLMKSTLLTALKATAADFPRVTHIRTQLRDWLVLEWIGLVAYLVVVAWPSRVTVAALSLTLLAAALYLIAVYPGRRVMPMRMVDIQDLMHRLSPDEPST